MSRPMNRGQARRVVMTRQPAQAGDVEAGLLAAGHTVQFLPLTDFELPAEISGLRRAVGRLAAGDYAWLVLTSPNTVRALVRAGWDGGLPHSTRVAVTGAGTARVLTAAGCPAAPWMPDGDASAAGIIAGFPAGPGRASAADADSGGGCGGGGGGGCGGRVLLPQSALATEEVAVALRSRGWSVDRLEAYRTVPYPAAPDRRLLDGPVAAAHHSPRPAHRDPASSDPARADAAVVGLTDLAGAVVVLTSPSAVRELTRQRGAADAATGARFVAIGQPTRRAAEAAGLELSGTARTPDANGILALL